MVVLLEHSPYTTTVTSWVLLHSWAFPGTYYDYQLSKARRKLGDRVLTLKLRCCHGQCTSFPLVTISSAVHRLSRRLPFSCALLPLTSTADKLPQETETVARDNNTIFTLKPVDQTFSEPYSTDNRSTLLFSFSFFLLSLVVHISLANNILFL